MFKDAVIKSIELNGFPSSVGVAPLPSRQERRREAAKGGDRVYRRRDRQADGPDDTACRHKAERRRTTRSRTRRTLDQAAAGGRSGVHGGHERR